MADIFISYSKEYAELTKAIAADLEARGFSTWWDTSLLPGDDYTRCIDEEIAQAKAVIVIWTPASVKSVWVLAEAQRGFAKNKLITAHVPGLDLETIPLPYNVVHSKPATDGEALYKTLIRRGIVPQTAAQPDRTADGQPGVNEGSRDSEVLFQRGEDYASARNGVAQDDAQAVEHYRQAAALGHMGAVTKLGLMYQDGRGVPRDDAEALRLYRNAADTGYPLASRQLGFMYENGRGVTANRDEARRWYHRAAEDGDRFAYRAWRRLGTPWKLSTYRRRGARAPAAEAKSVGEGGEEQG